MVRQSDIFIQSEGDRWLERNRAGLGSRDRVSEMIEKLSIEPTNVVEIGCSNGWRLAALQNKYGCTVLGVDPSQQAAQQPDLPIFQATAAALPIRRGACNVLIYGFCLYLTDPADWFTIVAEADRILRPHGHLIIHDFADIAHPYGRVYEHCDGVVSWHIDFAELWLANPLYSLVHRKIYADQEMVTVIEKLPLSSIEVLP